MIRPHKGIVPSIDASAWVDETAQVIGKVEIGENSSIWMGAIVRGDVSKIIIGKRSNVQDLSVLHGQLNKYDVVIGDDVTIGHNAMVHGCKIGDRCLIGMGAIILNGAEIGDDCIIAAGSVVTERTVIPAGSMVMGAPGKVRRELTDADKKMIVVNAEHYVEYKEDYK